MRSTFHLIALVAICLEFSCTDKHPKADLVLFNGNIYTLNQTEPKAEAVAVTDGKIVYVGNNVNANQWVADTTQIIDLEGKTVTPGFIEGHGHLMGIGANLLNLDLMNTRSYDEIVELVKAKVETAKKGEWIIGRGWHQDKWFVLPENMIDGFPTHHKLSDISPNNPVLLRHASGHALLANEKAMKLAGIDKKTANPDGGDIYKDLGGNPTGMLNETAQDLIKKVVPEESDERRIQMLNMAIEACLKNGITSFHDAGVGQKTIDLYESFLKNGLLKIRLYVMLDGSQKELLKEWYTTGPQIGLGDHFLTIRSIKLYADGALGSRGALLLEDYTDAPGVQGLRITPADHIMRVTEQGTKNGFQICTHCIGDRANHEVLDMYEIVLKSDTTKTNPRFRIEHAQHVAPDDIIRFGALGVIPSMQAIHMSSDRSWAIDRLGERRIVESAYMWQSLIEGGANVMNGTDAPVEPVNPLASFYASVTRQTLDGKPDNGYEPDQRMTREQALQAYTINNAYGAFEENIKGSVEIGKLADFTIFSKDIMKVPAQEILTTEIEYTIVNGKVLYQK
ncbi:amidohydrolase [Reichenbachiella carrageenanivorans]|uniref:Amidohydrolase n=1 Tax=Reichenbachiella carrageenanivorans TaxID=2979869 RepID=A0ABY6CVR5_9BACT|nr:amidohydrolase [Reichenbachiella carrageenanivorans]UXX77995.1 amidohydrolase [Reichenbachiella carrageenanivorans]